MEFTTGVIMDTAKHWSKVEYLHKTVKILISLLKGLKAIIAMRIRLILKTMLCVICMAMNTLFHIFSPFGIMTNFILEITFALAPKQLF